MAPNSYQFSARNDTIAIRGVHDVATDTYAETRKLEGKLDAHVNLVTQLVANQKPASVARVWGIRSSNDHHTSACHFSQQSGVVHDVATDTSADTRKLEGKLDALVILVIQLAANQKPAFVARVCGIRSSNDHHTSFGAINDAIVIRGFHDVAIDTSAETRNLEGKLDALVNLVTRLAFNARNDAIVIRGVHDVATDTSAETTKLEGKLDALLNLVTQLAANQKHASVARVCGIRSSNDHLTTRVHDVATDTTAETRKLEGKLDALMNLVTQLATNKKPASVARVCGIYSSDDPHTSVRPSSQQSGVDEHPEAYAAKRIVDHHSNTSAETTKLEGKLDALLNLVTQLAANQKPASVARVCGIRSSNDHLTTFSARNDAIVIRGVHDVATDTSAKTRKLEGKLDAFVNLVT
ncbi:hypothetical protein Fmac_015344 [Flemingia macrophylla]|uniref:Uncharacterized protein n=1 Tax=Flemingia macrophylla TaxID=520843 RepID=A0ABD1MEB9_9FABA